MIKITPFRMIMSTMGVFYVWSLPLLATLGFAEKGATSISGFIANPPATGAMAAVSFIPLTLMWEYQDAIIETYVLKPIQRNALYASLSTFQLFYGTFLICTKNYAPMWLHQTVVALFGTSFAIHGLVTTISMHTSWAAVGVLSTGIVASVCLIWVKGMLFWMFECIGMSAMILYTPVLWNTFVESEKKTILRDGNC